MVASMWIGNLMLMMVNLLLIGVWIRLLTIPYRMLFPAILVFSCVGVYSLANNSFDVIASAVVGVLGFLFVKLRCEPALLLLGFVLGPMMEVTLRRALLLAHGDATVFFTRPISLTLMIAGAFLLLIVIAPAVRRKREEAFRQA